MRFVDDSKATNVAAATAAIEAVSTARRQGRLIVLLGGRDKAADFKSMAPLLGRVQAIVVGFGEAGPRIARELGETDAVEIHYASTLRDAVREAARHAQAGSTVLLAPACASFDEFSGFAERGDVFAALVHELAHSQEPPP